MQAMSGLHSGIAVDRTANKISKDNLRTVIAEGLGCWGEEVALH